MKITLGMSKHRTPFHRVLSSGIGLNTIIGGDFILKYEFIRILYGMPVIVIYVIFFIRIMGRKEISQATPLDFIYIFLLGSIGWDLLLEGDYHLGQILAVMLVLSLVIFVFRNRDKKIMNPNKIWNISGSYLCVDLLGHSYQHEFSHTEPLHIILKAISSRVKEVLNKGISIRQSYR